MSASASSAPAICRGRKGRPGCGAAIRWPKNPKSLKAEPVDYEPRPDGNIAIEGGISVHLSTKAAAEYDGPKYISHFATCPSAESFRQHKPNLAPRRPSDIRLGTFESPASAAVGRISADALDLTVERLTEEFLAVSRDSLGARPLDDELQHLWRTWQREKRNMGVEPNTLELVAKRAKAQLRSAEVPAA